MSALSIEQGVTATPVTRGSVVRLRPGAEICLISPDELQIVFPDFTATFTTPVGVKGVLALLNELRLGGEWEEVVNRAARAVASDPALLDYLLRVVQQTNCLYEGDGVDSSDALSQFYAYLGDDPGKVRRRLADASVLVVAMASDAAQLAVILHESGLNCRVESLATGASCRSAISQLRESIAIQARPALLACWGFAYRSPLARLVNDLAIDEKTPILFGGCEGVTGRIGPYIIPRNTPCLECANLRLLSHASEQERKAFLQVRASWEDVVPAPGPRHPVFNAAVLRLFALELAEVAQFLPPRTLGRLIEHHCVDGSVSVHSLYKVPRCPSCGSPRPERLAWDARFAAPAVKGAAG